MHSENKRGLHCTMKFLFCQCPCCAHALWMFANRPVQISAVADNDSTVRANSSVGVGEGQC